MGSHGSLALETHADGDGVALIEDVGCWSPGIPERAHSSVLDVVNDGLSFGGASVDAEAQKTTAALAAG